RTLKARIRLANPGILLKPNMVADVRLLGEVKQNALLVPTEAVIVTGERSVVIVADGEGRFKPVDVNIGAESGDKTEIQSGLSLGQRVVTSGQFLIDSEASLKATVRRLGETDLPQPGVSGKGVPPAQGEN
ncbi:MAG: efflux RND transporter periplasmic adaptor subunit, partial [Burkholderiales bacterium]